MRTALPRLYRGHRYVQRDVTLRYASRCIVSAARRRSLASLRPTASHGSRRAIDAPVRLDDSVSKHTRPIARTHRFLGRTSMSLETAHSRKDGRSFVIPQLSPQESRDPIAWLTLLDKYLPQNLRIYNGRRDHDGATGAHAQDLSAVCGEILTILNTARQARHAATNLIVHMILNGRKRAALYIVDMLLRNLAFKFPRLSPLQTPSNILWPRQSLDDLCQQPIELETITHTSSKNFASLDHLELDPRYELGMSEVKNTTMTEVWVTLGTLVIESANMAEGEAEAVINAVMLALGQIHNLDLMPENVYSYRPSPFNSVLQRPPILHLLSSRILTALSDATWREQQKQLIEKATNSGASYQDIAREAPGGRFRLKVRSLGPEMWFEFILWCCVEGGFASAGWQLINALRRQDENPWFAISWTGNSVTGQTTPRIDWDRVRLRSGGTVGRIEGYSRDKPLVEMPHRTISTEAILGLVNTSIETVHSGSARGAELGNVRRSIVDLISFLEPHDLPLGYFDYLAVRLMQTGCFDGSESAADLCDWFEKMRYLKSLETAQPRSISPPSFDLNSLCANSELSAGILHQLLDGYVQSGNVHQALNTFNVLQRLVDESKLQAIGTFLENPSESLPGPLSGVPDNRHRTEFVHSHGQLPPYKLVGVLDLATDTGLVGFGQWLLLNDAPDGRLIPRLAFIQPSMAQAVLRFAAFSGDAALAKRVDSIQASTGRRKSAKTLEALIHADISTGNLKNSTKHLLELKTASAGGLPVGTLAHMAGAILRMEAWRPRLSDATVKPYAHGTLDKAKRLMHQMLRGDFDASHSQYTRASRAAHRQHIASLLQIFMQFPESMIRSIAVHHIPHYRSGNKPSLPTRAFNLFMGAAVEANGAMTGLRLWRQFCAEVVPDNSNEHEDHELYNEIFTNHDTQAFDADADGMLPSRESRTTDEPAEQEPREHPSNAASMARLDLHLSSAPQFVSQDSNKPGLEDVLESSNKRYRPLRAEASGSHGRWGQSDPVTVPDLRTLRLIVRQVLRERQDATRQRDEDLVEQGQVLEWAVKQYRAFNLQDPDIELETQMRLSDDQIRHMVKKNSPVQRIDVDKTRMKRTASDVEIQFGARPEPRHPRATKPTRPRSMIPKPEREAEIQSQTTNSDTFRRWLI